MGSIERKILIDIGCGMEPAKGYLGLDIRKKSKAKILAKLPDLPFKKNSINGFRARHVMEHFSSEQIFIILQDIARCLKVGGYFEVIVPHCTNPAASQLDHKTYWIYDSPSTLSIGGLHEELVGHLFDLEYRKLFWMRKEYKGRFPIFVKMMNYLINKNPPLMQRFSYYYGGIYEMEFRLRKI